MDSKSEEYKIGNTKLYFLEADCSKMFGEKQGKAIFSHTEELYNELCSHADFRNSKAIKYHLTMNLFPTLAYYKMLRQHGYEQKEALSFVRKEAQRAANIKKAEQAKTARMPFAYLMYRLFVKPVMKRNFPKEGWSTRWVQCDGKEIHFDMTRCIYKDICDKEGCSELCAVFCENDDIAFSGLMPKIRFERSGTLGKGADCCDFHFIKNK